MRRELERQNRGGPARRLLNRPAVLIALLALVIGVIVWTFWPLSEEQLYRRAATAAASANPDDWDRASEYLDALDRDHPHHGHQADVDELRRRLADRDGGAAGGTCGADGGADERGAMVLSGGDAAAAARRRGRGAAHLDGADAGVRTDAVGGAVGAAGGEGTGPARRAGRSGPRSIAVGGGSRCARRCGGRRSCARKARPTRPTPCCKGCATCTAATPRRKRFWGLADKTRRLRTTNPMASGGRQAP